MKVWSGRGALEEKVVELYKKGLIPGLAHPYIGQEAIAAAFAAYCRRMISS